MSTKFDLEKGIIPLSKFRQSAKSYLHRLKNDHGPLVLTQNGESAAVVLSPEDYQRLAYERNLFQAIAEGEKDVEDGRTLTHQELFGDLLK